MRAFGQGGRGQELAHPTPLRPLQGRGGGPREGQARPLGGRGHAAHRQISGPSGLRAHDHSRRLEDEKIAKQLALMFRQTGRIYSVNLTLL